MNPARAAYHEQSLGHGLDDYYSEWGERPGLWWGGGAELLGLEGYAAPGSIVSLVEGRDPASGEVLRRPTSSALITRRVFDPESGGVVERQVEQKRVGGWDFAFSAPKSISLALTVGDADTRRELLAAHRAAVEAALVLLESEAVRVRVGAQGAFRHETHGLLAVVIEHAWARAVSADATPDPQLHTHVVVANMAKSAEDDCEWWRTLDMQPVLREWKRATSATYQAVLRHEVSSRLGWEWAEPRNNLAELKQWPTSVLRAFSRRREQIEAFLAGSEPTWARAQAAAIQTRQAKGAPRDEATDRAAARTRLGEHLDAHQLAALLAPGPHAPAPLDGRRLGKTFAQLAGESGLTERASSFTRGDVIRELAFAVGSVPDADSLVVAAGAFLALEEVVQLDERRFTTRGLQVAEQRVTRLAERPAPHTLVLAAAQADVGIARVERERGFALSDEQRGLVYGVTADTASVSLVRAVAGSGKTTTLAAIAQAYERAGIPVAGVAPTGAAARVMSEAGIPARTVDRALLEREHALRAGIRPTSGIVLVDEAGTVGTRTLARLADAVALSDSRLVLVGDDAQLPAVAAGTTYANLIDQIPVHSLQTPRRFITPSGEPDLAEAHALANLRAGTLEGAVRYLNHKQQSGEIRTLDRTAALSAAAEWHTTQLAHGADPARIALIARSQEFRSLLNQRARESMREADLLGQDRHDLAATPLAIGDVVVCRRNDRALDVTNGARGRVAQIDDEQITLDMTDERRVAIPATYAQAGHLEHAYAITGHLAQAATFDAAMVVAPPHHHTRQWSYTALSRSRTRTELILVTDAPRDQPAEHAAPLDGLTTPDALAQLASCLTRDELETERETHAVQIAPRRPTLSRSR